MNNIHPRAVLSCCGRIASLVLFLLVMLQTATIFGQKQPVVAGGSLAGGEGGSSSGWVIAIHGGAGGPGPGGLSKEAEEQYMSKLNEALGAGSRILAEGGSSLDAVEEVVRFLEDCPLFNAGRGAVLNADGKVELDAAIMDGSSGMAGAVAAVSGIINPVSAARQVMEKTKHVMLVGPAAEEFAASAGQKTAGQEYFITPERRDAWKKWKSGGNQGEDSEDRSGDKKGTVGAVALDRKGRLAAATSTGGLMGKMPGRVGDSPIIGAGTYAGSRCAVSATGQGEFFMRNVVAYDVAARMIYRNMSLEEAARVMIMEKLPEVGGSGGLIAVDNEGNVTMPFNTKAMFRGFAKSTGESEVAIY